MRSDYQSQLARLLVEQGRLTKEQRTSLGKLADGPPFYGALLESGELSPSQLGRAYATLRTRLIRVRADKLQRDTHAEILKRALREGMVDVEALQRYQAEHQKLAAEDDGSPMTLPELLVARGALSADQLRRLETVHGALYAVCGVCGRNTEIDNRTPGGACDRCGWPFDPPEAMHRPLEAASEGDGGPLTGELLGRCKLTRKLGEGGMGAVYEALQLGLDRTVAVKVLAPEMAKDSSWRDRFLREARSAAKIEHPNVVRVLDVDRQADLYFIVMELVEGATAQALLVEQGTLEAAEAVRIAADAAAGLGFAHREGLIHRDIKPENLLVSRDGAVKVVDFGLARDIGESSISMTGQVMGSPAYMSPEQASGEDIDHRTDIYSLGVTLYALLAGGSPFRRASPMATMMASASEPLPPPPRGDLPGGLWTIIERMAAKDPADRFQEIAQVEEALRSLLVSLQTESVTLAPGRPVRDARPSPGAGAGDPTRAAAVRPGVGRSTGRGRRARPPRPAAEPAPRRPVKESRPKGEPRPARADGRRSAARRRGLADDTGKTRLIGAVCLALAVVIGGVLWWRGGAEPRPDTGGSGTGPGADPGAAPDAGAARVDRARAAVAAALDAGKPAEARAAVAPLRRALDAQSPRAQREAVDQLTARIDRWVAARVGDERARIQALIDGADPEAAGARLDAMRGWAGAEHPAVKALAQALSASPTAALADVEPTGDVDRWMQSALRQFSKDDARGAVTSISRAVEIAPDNGLAQYHKAGINYSLGDLPAALVAIDRAIALGGPPRADERFALRGQILEQLAEPEEAEAAYRQAVAASPGSLAAKIKLAAILIKRGKVEAAAAIVKSLRRYDRGEVHMLAGDLIVAGGHPQDALGAYIKARDAFEEGSLGRRMARAATGIAYMLMERQPGADATAAGKLFGPLIPRKDNNVGVVALLARWHHHRGEHRTAIKTFASLGSFLVSQPLALLAYARSLAELGYRERAARQFARAARWRPELVDRMPEDIGVLVRAQLADRQALPLEARLRVDRDHQDLAGLIGRVDGALLRNAFDLAGRDYEQLLGLFEARSLRVRVEGRLALARGCAGLRARLVAAIQTGRGPRPVLGGQPIVGADTDGLLTASERHAWEALDGAQLISLFERLEPSPQERLWMGQLAWHHGRAGLAHRLMIAAGEGQRDAAGAFLAQEQGLARDAAGTVVHDGRLMGAGEARARAAGQVRHEGRWMAPQDRDRLLRGERREGASWVRRTPEVLRAAGYVSLGDGTWRRPGDLDREARLSDRGLQAHATVHFQLRSDHEAAYLRVLGQELEDVYRVLSGQFGDVLGSDRLEMAVFLSRARFVGQRTWLREGAARRVGCAADDPMQPLDRLTRRAAYHLVRWHLRRSAKGAPAWVVRGLADQTARYQVWSGRFVASALFARRPLLRRLVERGHAPLSLSELLTTDAATLSRRGPLAQAIFDAEAGSAICYLNYTGRPGIKRLWRVLVESIRDGKTVPGALLSRALRQTEAGLRAFQARL